MKEKIGIGIIGTGSVTAHHINSIQELENCELIAIASKSSARAQAIENVFNIKAYNNYSDLIKNEEIDAIIICTESGSHMEPTIEAAQAGKHVLVEKPLDVTLDRAQQMIDVCAAAGVTLACVFQNRFSSDYGKLKQAVVSGKLGNLLVGNAFIPWYRPPAYYSGSKWKGTIKGDGGAALINQGVHTVDLLLDLMGNVESVFAKNKTILHDIEGEDISVSLLQYENGALGNIQASTALYPGYPERLEIYGEQGSVILEGGSIKEWNIKGEKKPQNEEVASNATGASDPMAFGHELHKRQIKNFVNSIIDNTTPLVSGTDAMRALKLILKIYESSSLGKEIKI